MATFGLIKVTMKTTKFLLFWAIGIGINL